jgi:hypothetical protein
MTSALSANHRTVPSKSYPLSNANWLSTYGLGLLFPKVLAKELVERTGESIIPGESTIMKLGAAVPLRIFNRM